MLVAEVCDWLSAPPAWFLQGWQKGRCCALRQAMDPICSGGGVCPRLVASPLHFNCFWELRFFVFFSLFQVGMCNPSLLLS